VKVLAYVRVSKNEQDTGPQVRAIEAWAGTHQHHIDDWIEEKVSASRNRARNRPGWRQVKSICRRRLRIDAVIVFRLDRAFRSVADAITEIDALNSLGVKFISISEALDLTTPAGEFMMHVIAAFAQFEARIISERIKAGLHGTGGRPPSIPSEKVLELVRKRREGVSWTELVEKYGFPKTTIRRAVSEAISRGIVDALARAENLSKEGDANP